jgi:hypothetical protein
MTREKGGACCLIGRLERRAIRIERERLKALHALYAFFEREFPTFSPGYDWLIIPADIMQRRRKPFGESARTQQGLPLCRMQSVRYECVLRARRSD